MADKIRVLQMLGAGKPGGAETFFLRLMRAFNNKDMGIKVLPVVRENSWVAGQLDEQGISYKTLPYGGIFDFKTKKNLQKIIDDFQPDIIQSWMNRASKYLPKNGVPKVARLGGYYNMKYYKNADYMAANTQNICKYIQKKGWKKEKIIYLPNFTEMPSVDYKHHRHMVRDSYKISSDAYVLLLAGRIHENKGFDVALYALRFMPKNVHILLAGNTSKQNALKAAAQADGLDDRITFAGWVPNISPLAAAADVWLVPSRHEPLGNTVLDAWAHTLPVVATSVSGPASLIDDGVTGLLVRPENEKDIVKAVEQLQNDPVFSEKIAQAGHKKLSETFSQDVVIQKYIDFYQKILKEKVHEKT